MERQTPPPAERVCRNCGRVMSIREWAEQRLCNDCAGSDWKPPRRYSRRWNQERLSVSGNEDE